MSAYRIVSKWSELERRELYAACFEDGYHSVWYASRERAVAAAQRRAEYVA